MRKSPDKVARRKKALKTAADITEFGGYLSDGVAIWSPVFGNEAPAVFAASRSLAVGFHAAATWLRRRSNRPEPICEVG